MAPKLKLMYFNGRGRAELARLILAYGELPFEDIRYEKEQWQAFKPKAPFGQLPLLEVDGELICQSMAIYRYLAKICGIAGEGALEEARVDMVADCCEDIVKPLIDIYMEKSDTAKVMKRESYISQQLPAVLSKLETMLKSNNNGDGFFVGDKLTWADIKLYHDITAPKSMGINVKIDDKYPKLTALRDKVGSCPAISAWEKKRPQTSH